ncbi:hypothetical protein BKA64DRAFT_240143 [Cadophora sp. MPI-SDFR-AT-0126]|nr:hypothetical protein BKA64DRAFT_240143 [Leotiomycetes sp. MPI-SDFR-AT-0126]
MSHQIVTHAAHAETITTRLQSQFIQALTVITILYLPPSLASTVFSMQETIFTNSKFHDWLYTLIGLFIATVFLVAAILALNHASVRAWLKNFWKSSLRFPFHVLRLFRFVKRVIARDRRPATEGEGIEMDDQDEDDSPDAGEV